MSVECDNVSPIALIKKVYPTIAELTKIENNVLCTETGCNQTFTSQSNLTMHIQKRHKQQKLVKSDGCIQHFHCPALKCSYNNDMFFNKLKYLKQHYLKTHADKKFKCDNCEKGFPTEWLQKRHIDMCGKKFQCTQCSANYNSKETLLTHIRRKNHKEIIQKSVAIPSPERVYMDATTKRFILPKPEAQQNTSTLSAVPLIIQVKIDPVIRVDKEIQTDSTNVRKHKSLAKRKSTQHTQTCNKKKSRKSAETQTIGDCILKRPVKECKSKIKTEQNAIETQTKSTNWHMRNEPYNSHPCLSLSEIRSDINLDFLNDNMMHSSSQTNFDNLNLFEDSSFGNCNSETQTDLIFNDEFLQSSVFQSHIETQTNEDPSLDLCSNMYTQTCNEILSELEFTNIQTQTNWPDYDMFVSTETQTSAIRCTKNVLENLTLNSREIHHTETQTEGFQLLLEEINA